MSTVDSFQGNTSMSSHNEDSMGSSITKIGPPRKHHIQNFSNVQTPKPGTAAAAVAAAVAVVTVPMVDDRDKNSFYRDLYQFHENKG